MNALLPKTVYAPGREPPKNEIVQLLEAIMAAKGAAISRGTLAQLGAFVPGEGEFPRGEVLSDPVPANNGWYTWSGSVWEFERGFPDTIAVLGDIGGSANAVTASTEPGVNPAEVVEFLIEPLATNTGPMTLSVNGEAAKPVRNYDGDEFAAGEWPAGRLLRVTDRGTEYRSTYQPDVAALLQQAIDTIEDAEQLATPGDGTVTFEKLDPELVQTSADPSPDDDADDELAVVSRVRDLIAKYAPVTSFATKADVENASPPASAGFLQLPNAGAMLDPIGAPSIVKPWHVQADNGQWWEMRFPDGKISLWAWAGANQGLGATNDTSLFQHAADYINRAWWETSGGAAQGLNQRGRIFVPPGTWQINPATPIIAFDFMKLEGAGDGQTIVRPTSTAAGALVQRPADATFNSNQRTTHVDISGFRFLLTGPSQTALDMAHSGRMRIHGNEFSRQTRVDDWNNANQSALSGTRAIRLRNSATVLVGGDIIEIDHNFIYWMDIGIESGNGTGVPGPEGVHIHHNEISDTLKPIIKNNFGGAGGSIWFNFIQRWAAAQRAIDIAARLETVGPNYLESETNTVPPILFRSGASDCVIHRRSINNYTAQDGGGGTPTMGTNDGSNIRDVTGTVLAAGVFT